MRNKKLILHLFISSITIYAIVSIYGNLYGSKYTYMFLLPSIFIITYPVYVKLLNLQGRNKLTLYFVLSLNFMRLVLTPFFGALTESYIINGFDVNIINEGILLLIYEHIITTFLLVFLFRKKEFSSNEFKVTTQKGSNKVYIGFLIFAFIIYLVFAHNEQLLDFVIKPIGLVQRSGDIIDTKSILVVQIIKSGLLFMFLIITDKMSIKYALNGRKIYFYIAIFSALFMISIIIGERRSNQLYVAFASALTLIYAFPSQKKKIISIIFSGMLIVIISMTIYKHFNAFLYDSYTSAIQSSSLSQTITANTLDSYFISLNTVSENIKFIKTTNLSLSNFIFDLFRNVFGVNFFINKEINTTSEIYNSSLYFGDQLTGNLFSSVTYGLAYFTFILSPIITCFNIIIAYWLEKKMRIVVSIEMTYIVAFIFIRLALSVFSNPAPLINFITMFFLINGSIFMFARFVRVSYSKRTNTVR